MQGAAPVQAVRNDQVGREGGARCAWAEQRIGLPQRRRVADDVSRLHRDRQADDDGAGRRLIASPPRRRRTAHARKPSRCRRRSPGRSVPSSVFAPSAVQITIANWPSRMPGMKPCGIRLRTIAANSASSSSASRHPSLLRPHDRNRSIGPHRHKSPGRCRCERSMPPRKPCPSSLDSRPPGAQCARSRSPGRKGAARREWEGKGRSGAAPQPKAASPGADLATGIAPAGRPAGRRPASQRPAANASKSAGGVPGRGHDAASAARVARPLPQNGRRPSRSPCPRGRR